MFRVFEYVAEIGQLEVKTPEQIATVNKIEQKLHSGEEYMMNNGFDKIVIEDFCDIVKENFEKCKQGKMHIVEL